jgi:hypothetical protein
MTWQLFAFILYGVLSYARRYLSVNDLSRVLGCLAILYHSPSEHTHSISHAHCRMRTHCPKGSISKGLFSKEEKLYFGNGCFARL